MRDWIAGAMTVLGTLLVLSGAAIIILRAWSSGPLRPGPVTTADGTDPATTTAVEPATERGARALFRLGPPDRLIAWGILLLVLAAIAAGAIGFELGASATAK
jgi:hypothetical protein